MKKILKVLVVFTLLTTFCGCYKGQESIHGEIAYLYDYDSASISNTDQLITEAIKNYASENNLTFAEYRMTDSSSKSFANTVDLASDAGARIILVPKIYQRELLAVHSEYPNTRFILLDGNITSDDVGDVKNVTAICFDWYEIGYFTGYLFTYKKYANVIFLNHENSNQTNSYINGLAHGMNDSATENKITAKLTIEDTFLLSEAQFEERIREVADSDFDLLVYHGDGIFNELNRLTNKTAQPFISIGNDGAPNIYAMVNIKRNYEILIRETLEKFFHGGFSEDTYLLGLKLDAFALQYNLGTMPENADFYYTGVVSKIKSGEETIIEDLTPLDKLKLKNVSITIK